VSALQRRLARLEAGVPVKSGPAWLGIRKWLGERLTDQEEAELAAYDARSAPDMVDVSGWSREARQWLGLA
jgi:hypothetical protein